MLDLHSHVLPGLDDGARNLGESLELTREAAAGGIEAIAATPHVRDDYPTTAEAMERALAEVRAAVAEAGVPIRVLAGGEIALSRLGRLSLQELRRFGLGGNPAYLLVETPYFGLPPGLEERLFRLHSNDITPVLAHPERNEELRADLERLAGLVRAGALVQVTAASLDGRSGKSTQAAAKELIAKGLAHLVASDAHGPDVRYGGLESVADEVRNHELASWLTDGVPRAIVAGTPLPPRPEQRRSRFRLWRR